MTQATTPSVTAFDLSSGEQVTADSARNLLAEAQIVELTALGLKSHIRIDELCNQNYGVIASSDTLRTLGRELLELADQADRPNCNQADIRELIDQLIGPEGADRAYDEIVLYSMKEHAHCVQMALLHVAEYYGHDLAWVKQKLCALSLDATIDLIRAVAVPDCYRTALNRQLEGMPGSTPIQDPISLGGGSRPLPVQCQEVYRHYGFFVQLIQRAAWEL